MKMAWGPIFLLAFLVNALAWALPTITHKAYYYDAVVKDALSLGVSTGALNKEQALEVFNSINGSTAQDIKPMPLHLQAQWQQLLYVAQVWTSLRASSYHFKVSFAVDTQSTKAEAGQILEGFYGSQSSFHQQITADAQGRIWEVTSDEIKKKTLLQTPFFTNIDEVGHFSAALWNLDEIGKVKQEFSSVPNGENASESTKALTIINFQLMARRFLPAIQKILEDNHLNVYWSEEDRVAILESKPFGTQAEKSLRAMRGTLLMQYLLKRSYELAEQRRRWNPLSTSSSSVDEFLSTLALKNNVLEKIFRGQNFQTQRDWVVGKGMTYGFEVEFSTKNYAAVVTPNDPLLRRAWQEAKTVDAKNKIIEDMGFVANGEYSHEKYAIFTSMLRLDLDRFPFMDIRPQLEDSGKMEVLSNGRGIYSPEDLKQKAKQIFVALKAGIEPGKPAFSYHFHQFIPQSYFEKMSLEQVEMFVRFLERVSFFLSIADFTNASIEQPSHRLDSWSLDRYSPSELQDIKDYLTGKKQLSNSAQKFHNIGFRPVVGGIDLEVRSSAENIDFGVEILNVAAQAVINKDFGPMNAWKSDMLFMEPRSYTSAADYKDFTLAEALSRAGYKLNTSDLQVLHSLQFEIYKPSMKDYMQFPNEETLETIAPESLDVKYLRTNFESNSVLALQAWEKQNFILPEQLALLKKERAAFIMKVYQLLQRIKTEPKYQFILQKNNFLDLCQYLERSTHPSKPVLTAGPEADRQRKILLDLVYEIRSYSVVFAKNTNLQNIFAMSLISGPVSKVFLSKVPAATSVKSEITENLKVKSVKENYMNLKCERLYTPMALGGF